MSPGWESFLRSPSLNGRDNLVRRILTPQFNGASGSVFCDFYSDDMDEWVASRPASLCEHEYSRPHISPGVEKNVPINVSGLNVYLLYICDVLRAPSVDSRL